MLPAVFTRIPAELLTVRQVREKMAAAPTGSSAVYGGSNADYLLVSTDRARPIDYENYCRAALSTLNLRFPAHAGEGLLAGETKTERAALDARLAPHGLRTAPLPKSLYDAFFVAFRLEQRAQYVDTHLACPSMQQLRGFLSASFAACGFNLEDLRRPELDHADFSTPLLPPLFDFPLLLPSLIATGVKGKRHDLPGPAIKLFETSEPYLRASFVLNERIVAWVEEQGLLPTQLRYDELLQLTLQAADHAKRWDRDYRRWFTEKKLLLPSSRAFNVMFSGCYRSFHHNPDLQLLLNSVQLEMRAAPEVFCLFRSGGIYDNGTGGYDPSDSCSLSFGSSALLGYVADPCSGGPLAERFMRLSRSQDFLVLNVDRQELTQPQSISESFVVIPPLRGIARVLSNGELYHPRLRAPIFDAGQDLYGIDLVDDKRARMEALELDLVRPGDRTEQIEKLRRYLSQAGGVVAFRPLPNPNAEEIAFFSAD